MMQINVCSDDNIFIVNPKGIGFVIQKWISWREYPVSQFIALAMHNRKLHGLKKHKEIVWATCAGYAVSPLNPVTETYFAIQARSLKTYELTKHSALSCKRELLPLILCIQHLRSSLYSIPFEYIYKTI